MTPNPDADDEGAPKPGEVFVPGVVRLLNGLPWLFAVAGFALAFCPNPACIPGAFWPFVFGLELLGTGGLNDGSEVEVAMVLAVAATLPEFPLAFPFAAMAAAR